MGRVYTTRCRITPVQPARPLKQAGARFLSPTDAKTSSSISHICIIDASDAELNAASLEGPIRCRLWSLRSVVSTPPLQFTSYEVYHLPNFWASLSVRSQREKQEKTGNGGRLERVPSG